MLTQSQSDVACEIRANSFGASLLSRSGPLSPVVLGLYHFMTAPSSLALTSRKPKGKFPARPSNKSRFLLWPCKIATSLFDPDFIFLPFHGPAVTSAVNSQLKWLWKDNSTPGAQTTDIEISWRTDIGDVQHDIMQQILHIFNTLDSRTI